MKNVMTELEMEKHLVKEGYQIEDNNGIDSTLVMDEAALLGYESYLLTGDGSLDETYLFVKNN